MEREVDFSPAGNACAPLHAAGAEVSPALSKKAMRGSGHLGTQFTL